MPSQRDLVRPRSRPGFTRGIAALGEAVNGDPEFRLASRYSNGSFRLGMGLGGAYVFRVRDGSLVDVNLAPTPFDAWDFEIAGPAEGWAEILARVPRPFYQDVASAILRHGFSLRGDVESYFAYHGALRRVVDVLRGMMLTPGAFARPPEGA